MSNTQPRYSIEEFALRGEEAYERDIRPIIKPEDEGKFVAIDIETGEYEISSDEMEASDRLTTRNPEAQIWITRVGSRYARRFGLR